MKDRLLKRIRLWSTSDNTSVTDLDSNDLVQSVRDDLEKLYNTKRGTVLVDDRYGLPDFNDVLNGYGEPDTDSIETAILKLTRQYEKRLKSVEVFEDERRQKNSNLSFRLTASLEYKNQALPFSAIVVLNDDGSTSVNM